MWKWWEEKGTGGLSRAWSRRCERQGAGAGLAMSSGLSVGERQGSKDGNRGRTGGGLDKQTNPWMETGVGEGGRR